MTPPQAPAQAPNFSLRRLRGRYQFVLTHTVGPDRGGTIRGVLTIVTDSSGNDSVSTGWPHYLSLAPVEQSAVRQSVDVLFGPDRRLSLVLGNPHLEWTDSGLMLDVFTVTDSVVVGRWVDGGLSTFSESPGIRPQGWFCLIRSSR